ncbi:hypothetical protein Tco_0002295 [Tanacetum coccineum]
MCIENLGPSRNCPKHVSHQSPREKVGSNDMVHNYYIEKAKKSAQLQKDKDVNGKPSMINPARLPNTANVENTRGRISRLFVFYVGSTAKSSQLLNKARLKRTPQMVQYVDIPLISCMQTNSEFKCSQVDARIEKKSGNPVMLCTTLSQPFGFLLIVTLSHLSRRYTRYLLTSYSEIVDIELVDQSDTKVLTMTMEILLEPTSNKLYGRDAPVMRTASAAAKPYQGDSSEFYLITGNIYTDQ